MAEFTNRDLRTTREARKMPRWQLAQQVGVSEDTVERWERGAQQPEPDDIDHIGEVLGDTTIWHRWMMSHYDSYRRRYTDLTPHDLPIAIMQAKYEIDDIIALQGRVERDAIDGRVDDPDLRARYIKEAKEVIASLQIVLQRI